jgi:hypothetical protein
MLSSALLLRWLTQNSIGFGKMAATVIVFVPSVAG